MLHTGVPGAWVITAEWLERNYRVVAEAAFSQPLRCHRGRIQVLSGVTIGVHTRRPPQHRYAQKGWSRHRGTSENSKTYNDTPFRLPSSATSRVPVRTALSTIKCYPLLLPCLYTSVATLLDINVQGWGHGVNKHVHRAVQHLVHFFRFAFENCAVPKTREKHVPSTRTTREGILLEHPRHYSEE